MKGLVKAGQRDVSTDEVLLGAGKVVRLGDSLWNFLTRRSPDTVLSSAFLSTPLRRDNQRGKN